MGFDLWEGDGGAVIVVGGEDVEAEVHVGEGGHGLGAGEAGWRRWLVGVRRYGGVHAGLDEAVRSCRSESCGSLELRASERR